MNIPVPCRALLGTLAVGTTTIALWGGILSPARAAEQITVTYQDTQVTVSLEELESFAKGGTLPDALGAFFNTSRQVPANVRSILVREIQVPKVIDRFLASSSGEFALLQLDEAIQGSNRSNNLNALRTAVETAGSDRQISVLELLATYPETRVSLDVSRLESTYNRVSNFVERVQPVLDLAIDALQNLICDCEAEAATMPETNDSSSAPAHRDLQSQAPSLVPVAYAGTQPCNSPSTTVEAPVPALLLSEATDTPPASPTPKLPLDPVQPPAPWAATLTQPPL